MFPAASLQRLIRGRRVGLACTPAAWWPESGPLEAHLARQADVRAFLALEHGLRGELQDGVRFDSYTDARTGRPVFSLYGGGQGFPGGFLEAAEVVVFCAQDVSHRAYTFHQAMAELLTAAAAAGKPVVVVDRPTPLAHLGAPAPPPRQFFPLELPVVIPWTLGELAHYLVAAQGLRVDLTVIRAAGWRRDRLWNLQAYPWVPPSPNIPTLDSTYAYAATGILQATTVSEGRGTCKPFEYIGAPFLDGHDLAERLTAAGLPGTGFRELFFKPGFNKYAGQACGGVHLQVTDRRRFDPLRVQLHLLKALAQQAPGTFRLEAGFGLWLDGGEWSVGRLAGLDIASTLAAWRKASAALAAALRPHLLYRPPI